MLRLENKCHVTFLPAYAPSAEEKADAALFAQNVRRSMVNFQRETDAEHRAAAAAGTGGLVLAGTALVVALVYWIGATAMLHGGLMRGG